MPPKKDLSIRLSAELREALDRAAAQSGETITAIVERALAAHLGVMQGPSLADRVRVLELTVADLQRNATPRPTPSPDNADPPPTLTAAQAYALAKDRGWQGNQAQFINWARTHASGLDDSFGLKMADRYSFVDIAPPAATVASPQSRPFQNGLQAPSNPIQVSQHPQKPHEKPPLLTEGIPIGEALIQAGAPLKPHLCRGGNRSRDLKAKVGMGAAEWLKAQGWTKVGKDSWAPPLGLEQG